MRWWVVGLSAGAAIVAAAGTGCSSSSSPAAGPPDASLDQSAESDAAAACPIDSSIATYNFPDSALGDSGGTANACGACLNANCAADVAACDEDCSCLQATKAVLDCGADGGTAFSCAMAEQMESPKFVTLALCIFESCAAQCALNGLVDAGATGVDADAGATVTSDASPDAATVVSPADGASDSAEQ